MSETVTTRQTVFIHHRVYKTLGLLIDGEKIQVPVKGGKSDAIGAMLVYEKIPDGADRSEYTEAEI